MYITSPEKGGKRNRNLPKINLILKILKYNIKSWKHCQNLGRKEDFEKKIVFFFCPKNGQNGPKIPPEDEFRLRMASFFLRSL